MKTTIELLDTALTRLNISERRLSVRIGLSPSNLSVARNRRSLSPVAAGQIAELLGEDVQHWIAVAALELQPRSRVTDHLRRVLHAIA
jgi:plasmid maintenance system antidote protein VapI